MSAEGDAKKFIPAGSSACIWFSNNVPVGKYSESRIFQKVW